MNTVELDTTRNTRQQPNKDRPLAIAQLTSLLQLPAPEIVHLAAATGCQQVGLRLSPFDPGGPVQPLITDTVMRRRTLAAMAATGVSVLDIEVVRIGPGFTVAEVAPLLAVSAELGARHLLVACNDADESRFTDSFSALCEAAAAHGLTAELEFMPYTPVADLSAALRIVERSAHPAGGVLIDQLHFSRSNGDLAQVAAAPRRRLRYMQTCDIATAKPRTVDEMVRHARFERLAPGQGTLDAVGLLACLPEDLPISIEAPNAAAVSALGVRAWVAQTVSATRRVLEFADHLRYQQSSFAA